MDNGRFDEKIDRLVSGLIDRMTVSQAGSKNPINWEEVDDDTFELTLTKSSIRISSKDRDGVAPFIMRILDDEGRIVDSVLEPGDGLSPYFRLDDLYVLASRNSRGIDQKLDEILDELGIPTSNNPTTGDPWGRSSPQPDDEPHSDL